MKKVLTCLLVCFSVLIATSQNKTTKTILGKTYSLSYDETNYEFEICENEDNVSSYCKKKTIESNTNFELIKALSSELTAAVDNFKFAYFENELKLETLKDFDYSLLVINNDSSLLTSTTTVALDFDNNPDYFPEFKVKSIDTLTYVLSSDIKVLAKPDTISFRAAPDLETLKPSILARINVVKENISQEVSTSIRNDFDEMLSDFYTSSISKRTAYTFLTTEQLITIGDTIAKPYNFSLLLTDKISLKVSEQGNTTHKIYGKYDLFITEAEFINNVVSQHSAFEDVDTNKKVLKTIYYMIKSKTETKEVAIFRKAINDSIVNVFEQLENAKKTYSGQVLINKKIPLYKLEKLPKKWYWFQRYGDPKLYESIYFLIESVNVHFFNNRADNITIVGKLSNDTKNTRVLTNRLYSLPLREFANRKQTNNFTDENNNQYTYYYDDVLDYLPLDKFNYAIKNQEVIVKVGDTTKIVERKIGDYFTGIFFSDFLGLNSNNSNGLIVAEGRIRIPWHLRNYRKATLFDNITAYASVNLFSGFENNSRKIELDDIDTADETSAANALKFTTNNFNLLSNNNIDAGISITPYTFEWKGASTFIHARYGLRFLRTGVEYNLISLDSTVNDQGETTITENIVERKGFQVFSIGQEAEINFEIRPQSSVGADVTVGLNWFRATGTNKNDVGFKTTNNAPNLKLMANIYALTNSEKGHTGVYFRIGGHYNLGTYKVFPQMMVGYATNLSSFVNKVNKE